MSECCAPAYGEAFGARGAERAAERYRRKGVDRLTARLLAHTRARAVEGASVLEIGGGIGALHLELLRSGAARAANVELSPEWEDAARELLREQGVADRVDRVVGDAVAIGLPAADLVVLHRVVCCYPDPDSLVGAAAARAERLLVLSVPRDSSWVRLVFAVTNLPFRLRRISFRAYVHPQRTIDAAAERHRLRKTLDRAGLVWRIVAFERAVA